ncbi:hypothetical protein JXB28_06720 [Candidatus Woesearchaeota archaeon]|nr:hypothetical protein [Candidatus Woesearchaeota archaeon]
MEIIYDSHASGRLAERADQLGISIDDALGRVKETLLLGNVSKSKRSRRNLVYCKYFHDNTSFFVVCKRRGRRILIKTVIIKEGRE